MNILLAGAATLALATASTLLLPRQVQVQRSALIDASPEQVIALAASTDGFQQFNPYLTADPKLQITPFGPSNGIGAGFAFDGKDGKGTQTISAMSETSVTYVIDLGPMGQPTQTISATPENGQTRVTWSVDSDMGHNPLFRVFGLFMDGMMGRTFETGLDNLARVTA